MKALKIILLIFFVLIAIGSMIVFAVIKNFDINKYKDKLQTGISQAIDRQVTFDRLDFEFGLSKGLKLKLLGLNIEDDSSFSSESFASAKMIRLDLDIARFMHAKEIIVNTIEIYSPHVFIIRNKAGQLNVPQGKDKSVETNQGSAVPSPSSDQENISGDFKDIPKFLVKRILIKDGDFSFTDQMPEEAISLNASQVNVEINNFTVNEQVIFKVDGAVFSEKQNIHLKGKVNINTANQEVTLSDLTLNTQIQDLSVDLLREGLPGLKDVGISKDMRGDIRLNLNELVLRANQALKISADGELSNGKLKLEQLQVPFEDITMKFRTSGADLMIDEAKASLANGTINVSGSVNALLTNRDLDMKLDVNGIELNKLVNPKDVPVKFEGYLFGQYQIRGRAANKDTITNDLSGQGTFEIKDGKLIDVNILKIVLEQLTIIPPLANLLKVHLSIGQQKKFISLHFNIPKHNGLALDLRF